MEGDLETLPRTIGVMVEMPDKLKSMNSSSLSAMKVAFSEIPREEEDDVNRLPPDNSRDDQHSV